MASAARGKVLVVVVMVEVVTASGARAATSPSPIVTTPDGSLRGIRIKVPGSEPGSGSESHPYVYVDAFHNIPYAKPPLGDLRFRNPEVNDPWTGVRDASSPGNVCPQSPTLFVNADSPIIGDVDCLYLNVFTPKLANRSGPMPVMVFIHGGGYFMGTGNLVNGTHLAAKGVVLVAINYRLGALGFLSTEDSASRGNYGLWDIIRALEWVRNVISCFNGDPHDVTVFGQSAGGDAIALLIVSPEGKGLFHKAIIESGGSLHPWTLDYPNVFPHARQLAFELASRAGCDVSNSSVLIGCLRGTDARTIVKISSELQAENNNNLLFLPIIGQERLLSDTPDFRLKNGFVNDVTIIRGFNSDEMCGDPEVGVFTVETFRNKTREFVKTRMITAFSNLTVDVIVNLVTAVYVTLPGVTLPIHLRDVYVQMTSDFAFVAPALKETKLLDASGNHTQYLYEFSYRSANRLTPTWCGASHADELLYVLDNPADNTSIVSHFVSSWTHDDIIMSERMMTWWTNFAKHGNPTPVGSGLTQWLPWGKTTPRYLNLGLRAATRMVSLPDSLKMKLWNEIIPAMNQMAKDGLLG